MPGGVWVANFWFWPQSIYEYHKSTAVFACPSSRRLTLGGDNPTRFHGLHYGVNRIIMPTTGAPLKESDIVASASTYLGMDAGTYVMQPAYLIASRTNSNYIPGYGDAGGPGGCNINPTTELNAAFQQDCQSGRHFGGVNVMFADGHAKWLKTQTLVSEARKYNATTHPASAWDPLSE